MTKPECFGEFSCFSAKTYITCQFRDECITESLKKEPTCFGHDDCSSSALVSCPWAGKCGQKANENFKDKHNDK